MRPQRHIMQYAATSRMGTYTSCYKITPIIIWVFRPIKLNGHFRSLRLIHLSHSPPPPFKTNSFMIFKSYYTMFYYTVGQLILILILV